MMPIKRNSVWALPVFSGLLLFIAMCEINFLCSWFCYVPLFVSVIACTPAQSFKRGMIFGGTVGTLAFSWMISAAGIFTGKAFFYGFCLMTVSVIFLSVYHAAVVYLLVRLRSRKNQTVNAVLAASLICAAEFFLMFLSAGFPWVDEHSGSGLTENLFSIQPASFFGVHILSFVVVLVNYLIADCFADKNYKKLLLPALVFSIYMCTGILLHQNALHIPSAKAVRIAILAENIPPEIIWSDENGNALAQGLVDLNTAAAVKKPELMLWSESGIPWNYSNDDLLLKEVFRITDAFGGTHILGMNTENERHSVFNSAYSIAPGGKVISRYDKQHLLAIIERPFFGLVMPFFSGDGFTVQTDPSYALPLKTPYGKAGVMLCNESTIPTAAASMVRNGAQYLLNMSNDGWFRDTYIVRDHFYTARLRAVETRKDLVINSNNGYSGKIRASGEIELMKSDRQPFVELVSAEPNNEVTLSTSRPYLFIYACFLVVLIFSISRLANHLKINRTLIS
jgi:apolipoprotein N-acyltransferase